MPHPLWVPAIAKANLGGKWFNVVSFELFPVDLQIYCHLRLMPLLGLTDAFIKVSDLFGIRHDLLRLGDTLPGLVKKTGSK